MTTQKNKLEVKSTRFVGSDILTKAKISIKSFADELVKCFDPKYNKEMAKDMEDMGMRLVIPSLILTDTDSVYYNYLAIYKTKDISVTEDQYQEWIRDTIVSIAKIEWTLLTC